MEASKARRDPIRSLLAEGKREGVFPGAVLLVARRGKIVYHQQIGDRILIPQVAPMRRDTIFDLASLTKPLATTLALMKLVDEGRIYLDQRIQDLLPVSLPAEKGNLTLRLLLAHSSGLAGWKPFYAELEHVKPLERKKWVRDRILEAPLAYRPGEGVLYSDLGFMLLEWIVEEAAAMPMPEFLLRCFYGPLALKRTLFLDRGKAPLFGKAEFAATEKCPWRNEIVLGFVHDENAFALGGFSGHSGLFGTAGEVYLLINVLREHYFHGRSDYLGPGTVREFFTRQDVVKGSSWALGWDTPSPGNSSSGRYFSEKSVGHLGFTGTSVWMDLEQDVLVVFLSNRVHPTRGNERIRTFRPRLHDAIMEVFVNAGERTGN